MPNLQIKDLPESLYRLLKERARKERRSLAQEAAIAIARGLQRDEDPRERRKNLLKEIENNPVYKEIINKLDPVALVREDRDS